MEPPCISVVMPVYNSQRFVGQAVESILNQTYRDFELIIVDDGSTDGSYDILQDYARSDDRIVLVRQANGGVAAASNRGLAVSRGEFLARMDHDDIAMPYRFQRQVEYLKSHPECLAVGGKVLMIDTEGYPIRVCDVALTHEEIEARMPSNWAIFHPTMMARIQAMRSIGGYSIEFSNMEDLDLYLKLAEHGRLANIPEVLLQYRQHFSSLCYTKGRNEHQHLRERIVEEASKRRGKDLKPLMLKPATRTVERPTKGNWLGERETRWAYEKMWAWWALESSYIATARRHALKALRIEPFRFETWLLLWCALRGH